MPAVMTYQPSRLVLVTPLAVLCFIILRVNIKVRSRRGDKSSVENLNNTVERLPPFDYKTVKPISYRPFKTKTHISMGISKCPKDDWIQIDQGYLARLAERKNTIKLHADEAIGWNAASASAVGGLFTEVIEHLPRRFPTMFRMQANVFHNLLTGAEYSVEKALLDPIAMLRILSENVEEDFFFMCPNADGIFCLQGYIACFPGGFSPCSRVGMSIREIHQTVPGYEKRLGKGVDNFMARMKGGDLVQRMNWSLQTDGSDLWRLDGNNFYPEGGHAPPETPDAVDINQSYLRVERQSLRCLSKSKAIVFCVRSYLTPLEEIVREHLGPELADAIESMPEKVGHYKKRSFWAEQVYAFLRAPRTPAPYLETETEMLSA